MFRFIFVASLLLLCASSAFTQEILEDKKTGKLYHKTKNAAGEWVITEYPTKRVPVGPRPGADLTNADIEQTKQLPSGAGAQAAKDNPIGYSPTGKPIYRGPRGGEYHRSESGNKVYHPRGSASSGRSSSGGGGRRR